MVCKHRAFARCDLQSRTVHNHWFPLHEYAVANESRWQPAQADAFVAEWLAAIPEACGCGDDWRQRAIAIRTDSPENFFQDANAAHNLINAAIDSPSKPHPQLSLAQAYGTWRKSGRYELLSPICRPSVDVVIPFHAGDSRFVHLAVESMLSQLRVQPILHVIADGCPWPDTLMRLQTMLRINRYETPGNYGPYAIGNAIARDFAQSKYLAILDADDTSHCDRLWRQIATMDRYGYEMTSCAMANVAETPQLDARSAAEPILLPGRVWKSVPYGRHINSTRTMTREMFLRLGGFSDMFCSGDFEFDNRAHLSGVPSFWSENVLGKRLLQCNSLTNGPNYNASSPKRIRENEKLFEYLQKMQHSPRIETSKSIGIISHAPALKKVCTTT